VRKLKLLVDNHTNDLLTRRARRISRNTSANEAKLS